MSSLAVSHFLSFLFVLWFHFLLFHSRLTYDLWYTFVVVLFMCSPFLPIRIFGTRATLYLFAYILIYIYVFCCCFVLFLFRVYTNLRILRPIKLHVDFDAAMDLAAVFL